MAATPSSNLSFQNFFSTTLSSDITASSTDILLDAIPNGVEGFLVIDPDTSSREVIFYTSKTATKVVCPSVADGRGQDDTVAGTHLQGTTVIMAPLAAYFEALVTLFTTTPQGWSSLAGSFTSVAYSGNRSYTMSTSTDQTSILSRGMRLRFARNTTAPVQCTSLNGTTQYYSKSSPAGMTFTDDFTVSAWVKLNSYGAAQGIMSRWAATPNGWRLYLDSSGAVNLQAVGGGGAANRSVISYQSVPLNKWVHIAASIDISAATGSIYLDGVLIPSTISGSGAALTQAGNLEVGSIAGASFFNGKIAQAAVYSTVVSAANIQAAISQGLSGSETNLISAYSFNNSINDLSANANNLTANGSAVATNSDSPFTQNDKGTPGGTYDYGIVTDVTSTTITVQVPEGNALTTTGTFSAVAYSTFKAPYGMPSERGKWSVVSHHKTQATQAAPVSGTWYNLGSASLSIPSGAWDVQYIVALKVTSISASANITSQASATLSSANNTESNAVMTSYVQMTAYASGTSTQHTGMVSKRDYYTLTTLTPLYLNAKVGDAGNVSMDFRNADAIGLIVAENAYL